MRAANEASAAAAAAAAAAPAIDTVDEDAVRQRAEEAAQAKFRDRIYLLERQVEESQALLQRHQGTTVPCHSASPLCTKAACLRAARADACPVCAGRAHAAGASLPLILPATRACSGCARPSLDRYYGARSDACTRRFGP